MKESPQALLLSPMLKMPETRQIQNLLHGTFLFTAASAAAAFLMEETLRAKSADSGGPVGRLSWKMRRRSSRGHFRFRHWDAVCFRSYMCVRAASCPPGSVSGSLSGRRVDFRKRLHGRARTPGGSNTVLILRRRYRKYCVSAALKKKR